MSLRVTMDRVCGDGFPRVSGDEPEKAMPEEPYPMFSPRERG